MKLNKNTFFSLMLGSLILTACQSQPVNTLTFTTPTPATTASPSNQPILVNVIAQDLRSANEVSSYTKNSELVRLTAQPTVAQMFQQVMWQHFNSKGLGVTQGVGNANAQIKIRKFFANVDAGNLRHNINAEVAVEVAIQASRGSFVKTFNASRGQEGVFGVSHNDIQKVLALAYEDVVQAIYNDNEITQAIQQYK